MKRSREDVIYDVIIFFILTLIFLIVAYPLYFVVISSFSDPVAVAGGKVIFYPIGFTLDGYKEVFKTQAVMRGFLNSLIYTAVGVCVNLAVTIPTSYALSRKDFPLNRPITLFYIVTMFVGGGMMPTYLVVRDTGLLGRLRKHPFLRLYCPSALWCHHGHSLPVLWRRSLEQLLQRSDLHH